MLASWIQTPDLLVTILMWRLLDHDAPLPPSIHFEGVSSAIGFNNFWEKKELSLLEHPLEQFNQHKYLSEQNLSSCSIN